MAQSLLGCDGLSGITSTESETGAHDSSSPPPAGAAEAFVESHNSVRAEVEEPPNYPGSWRPLPPVSWSTEVATSAQGWAEHLRENLGCGLQHDTSHEYGENLAAGTGLAPNLAVEMWAREKADYVFNPEYQFDSRVGHYTQVVWRESTRIGCGSAKCGNSTVVVCRYSPPGNFLGAQPY